LKVCGQEQLQIFNAIISSLKMRHEIFQNYSIGGRKIGFKILSGEAIVCQKKHKIIAILIISRQGKLGVFQY